MSKRIVESIWLSEFINDYLAPDLRMLGFRKKRRRFRKDRGAFFEYYSFEDRRSVSEFFLWVGVEFKDISSQKYSSILTHCQIHWAMPIHRVLSEAPKYFAYDIKTSKDDLKETVVKLISNAGDVIDKDVELIRQKISNHILLHDEWKEEILSQFFLIR